MKRRIYEELVSWKRDPERMPLLVRGARQVGKSFVIEEFGKNSFENLIVVNFELKTEICSAFEKSLDPQDIVPQLERFLKAAITPGKTLLFFDEIQVCPRAIMALRYFHEKMPELHVIGAGSLLEFAIEEKAFSFPVGRVQFLYLKPFSLREFFFACNHERILQTTESASLKNPIDPATHRFILNETKPYFLVGGMPKSIDTFLKNNSYFQCQQTQEAILITYQNDFTKYATKAQHKYLKMLFEKAPRLVGNHFKYSKVDNTVRSRELKVACEQLSLAGLIHPVHATAGSGLPFQAEIKENKFKLVFLDIGLMQNSLQIDPAAFFSDDFFQTNSGDLAEQFVGQELLAYGDCYRRQELFFWEREKAGSSAQVDYLIHVESKIIPVEVKAGKTGHLKSLKVFMEEKGSELGIQISQAPLALNGKILSVPLYMIDQIPRLVQEVLRQ